MAKITIRQVAREAGVSPATASRALSAKQFNGPISDGTREKVIAAAARLHYTPRRQNEPALPKRVRTIGLIVPELTNPYYAELTQTIADRLRDLHCQTIIAVTADKFEKEFEYDSVRALLRRRVDAIIAIPASMTSPRVWQSVLATPTKLIFVDRDLRDQFPQVDSVSINNYEGARMATRYLFSAGHTHIGYLTGPLTASTLHDRLRGYKDAFRDFSREWEREYVQECSFAIGPRLNAARKLLALDPPPTAILAPSNLLAEAVLVAIRERGQPLAEISLIMFDDVPWATLTSPRLTTVSNPTKKLGKAAIDLLQRKLTEESISRPEHIQLQVADLVVRESTHVVIANPTRPATPDDPPQKAR